MKTFWSREVKVWSWLADGATVYICGDAKRMAKDVERALVDIVAQFGARSTDDAVSFLGELNQVPDVLCRGGWWRSDPHRYEQVVAEYHGVRQSDIVVGQKRLLGKTVEYFSSSHERSHGRRWTQCSTLFARMVFPRSTSISARPDWRACRMISAGRCATKSGRNSKSGV